MLFRSLGGQFRQAGLPALLLGQEALEHEAVAGKGAGREGWNEDIEVQALPGPTALIPALTASALPSDRFVFEGFLPKKKGRQTRLNELSAEPRTMVIYESPYRLLRTLDDLTDHLGADRQAAVARELTKTHEEIERGTLEEVRSYFAGEKKVRGECVIVVRGAS